MSIRKLIYWTVLYGLLVIGVSYDMDIIVSSVVGFLMVGFMMTIYFLSFALYTKNGLKILKESLEKQKTTIAANGKIVMSLPMHIVVNTSIPLTAVYVGNVVSGSLTALMGLIVAFMTRRMSNLINEVI